MSSNGSFSANGSETFSGENGENADPTAASRAHMYQLVVPAFLLLSLLAILANALVILALRTSRMRNATVALLMSLTFSDIWSCSVMGLSLLLNSYLPTVFHTRPQPCMALCLEMFRTGALLTAALHLLLIALHHCVGIVRPHQDKLALRRLALLCCLCAWILPPASLFLLALIRPGQGLWNCTRVDFYYERPFRWAISGLLFGLFLAISLCYARLLFLLHDRGEKMSCTSSSTLTGHQQRKRRRERRTLGTTLLICASFLLGWAPASILFALTCADCQFLLGASFPVLFGLSCMQLAFLLAKSLLNPLIYSLRIPEVRQQFGRHLPLVGGTALLLSTRTTGTGGSTRKCRSHLFASSFSSIRCGGGGGDESNANDKKRHRPGPLMLLLVPDRMYKTRRSTSMAQAGHDGHGEQKHEEKPNGWATGQRLAVPRRSECLPEAFYKQSPICRTSSAMH